MIYWNTFDIGDNCLGFLYRRNRFEQVLEPGRHRFFAASNSIRVEMFDVSALYFDHSKARFLLNTHGEKLAPYVGLVDLKDTEVGLVYRNGHLARVLAPGSYFTYWKNVEAIRVEIVDITNDYQIDEQLLPLLGKGQTNAACQGVYMAVSYVEVPSNHLGILEVNGKRERMLSAGSYGFWKFNRSVNVKLLDLRLQCVEVNGQEILSKDRVSLRMNLSVSFKIANAELALSNLGDINNYVYRELQLALREAVGTKTLDELLADKNLLNDTIRQSASENLLEHGIVLLSVGLRDIVLPGDMKAILNRVVEAQKESEANLIKRREETQAMRSLHNTAKMMENNPTLMRLKELEALERVTDRIDKITVFGGLEGVLTDLIKLRAD